MALTKHPQVNTSWQDEQTIYHQHVHMGVAVAVEDGLVVPVIPSHHVIRERAFYFVRSRGIVLCIFFEVKGSIVTLKSILTSNLLSYIVSNLAVYVYKYFSANVLVFVVFNSQ